MRTLLVDNYDSFTYNLYQLLAEVNGETPWVVRNDELGWDELQAVGADNIVLSPGPGRPDNERDFGICQAILLRSDLPVLGVCLGHQGLGHAYGASLRHAPEVMHGRASEIDHNGEGLFRGLPSPFTAVRYHSLIVEDVPDCLEVTARTRDDLVMGLRHRDRPLYGVQFHPESIGTEHGKTMLRNFREITSRHQQGSRGTGAGRPPPGRGGFGSLPSKPSLDQGTADPHARVVVRQLDLYPDAESAFVHLFGNASTAYWLDSSHGEGGLSRFSFMGDDSGPHSFTVRYATRNGELTTQRLGAESTIRESIFDYLNRELRQRRCPTAETPFDFGGGFVGYFGYELKAECGSTLVHASPWPDAAFLFADRVIVFDHEEKRTYLVCYTLRESTVDTDVWFERTEARLRSLPPPPVVLTGPRHSPVDFRLSRSHDGYLRDIQHCLDQIVEGESYEVCLTNRVLTDLEVDPLSLYRILRRLNPAPYAAFLRFEEFAVACSSPERFLRIDRDRIAESKPIKGTRRRGSSPEEDRRLRESLRASVKDRAENLMIVDLLRNDLGRVCEIGSIHVPKLMDVETYATVHQMVSTIRGRLAPEATAVDCIRAMFPGGSMTGAPKLRTMEIIDRLEQEARGIYSGALGYLSLNGCVDLNIVIRTAVVSPYQISIGTGGAIVALSDPQEEFEETVLKAQPLMNAIEGVTGGTPAQSDAAASVNRSARTPR